MSVTINGSGLASGVTSVPNLATFPAGPGLAAINMPTGSVIQVVCANLNGITTTNSTTFVSTGFSASITPQFTSSRILACVTAPLDSQASGYQAEFTFYRGGSDIVTSSSSGNGFGNVYSASGRMISTVSGIILDAPGTTSSTTYTIYFRSSNGSQTVQWGTTGDTVITLMEIR